MNTLSLFSRIGHSSISRRAAVLLVALVWSSLAFCGEIHEAANAGDLAKVKALLKDNPDLVSSKDSYGLTPLHYAAWQGHKEVAELLLIAKADINAKANDGRTPLHVAAYWGQKDVAALLLVNQADVNAKDEGGWTPLHYAAWGGQKDVAALLLIHKADVNAKANDGRTPLHAAAYWGHKDVVKLLRQHGGHK
jgi:ankyrin repeat protein